MYSVSVCEVLWRRTQACNMGYLLSVWYAIYYCDEPQCVSVLVKSKICLHILLNACLSYGSYMLV